jgi:hypothetical protein
MSLLQKRSGSAVSACAGGPSMRVAQLFCLRARCSLAWRVGGFSLSCTLRQTTHSGGTQW